MVKPTTNFSLLILEKTIIQRLVLLSYYIAWYMYNRSGVLLQPCFLFFSFFFLFSKKSFLRMRGSSSDLTSDSKSKVHERIGSPSIVYGRGKSRIERQETRCGLLREARSRKASACLEQAVEVLGCSTLREKNKAAEVDGLLARHKHGKKETEVGNERGVGAWGGSEKRRRVKIGSVCV